MTEKRFQWIYIKDNTLELRDNGIVKVFNNERIEELLNGLNDENEQLKSKNKGLKSELQIFKKDVTHSNLQINKLAEENEQLKDALNQRTEQCDNYYKENEQLKSELTKIKRQEQEVIEYLRTYHKGDVKELKSK